MVDSGLYFDPDLMKKVTDPEGQKPVDPGRGIKRHPLDHKKIYLMT